MQDDHHPEEAFEVLSEGIGRRQLLKACSMTPVRPVIVSPPRIRAVVLSPPVGKKYGSSLAPVVASFWSLLASSRTIRR